MLYRFCEWYMRKIKISIKEAGDDWSTAFFDGWK